jgi:hypothetical protein
MKKVSFRGTPFVGAVPLATIHFLVFLTFLPDAIRGATDFRHLYTAGYMLLHGHGKELYDFSAMVAVQNQIVGNITGGWLPFNHLSFEAVFFVPFALMPFGTAYLVFLAVNFALLFWSMSALKPAFGDISEVPEWLIWVFPFGFVGCFAAIAEGQDSILLLTLMVLAVALMRQDRDLAAGSTLALSLFKFQFVLPIVALYACWKRWRLVSGFILSAALLLAISVLIVGPEGVATYFKELQTMAVQPGRTGGALFGISTDSMVNLRGLVSAFWSGHPSDWERTGLIIAMSLAVMVWGALQRPSFSLSIGVAVLVSYHCFVTDAVILLIPLATMIRRAKYWTALLTIATPSLTLIAGLGVHLMSIPIAAMTILCARREGAAIVQVSPESRSEPSAANG